jgi:hypothetical protein
MAVNNSDAQQDERRSRRRAHPAPSTKSTRSSNIMGELKKNIAKLRKIAPDLADAVKLSQEFRREKIAQPIEKPVEFGYKEKSQRSDVSELRSGFPNLMMLFPRFRKLAKERT